MDCFEFGKKLIITGDLDPVYILLWEGQLKEKQLKKWLIAYWCFYHMGTASWISEGKGENFWVRMATAAESKAYPRCPERRHFRGQNAIRSVAYLQRIGVDSLLSPLTKNPLSCEQVMRGVRGWLGFGPWIAFKVADMLERLDLAQVHFDESTVFLFDSPKKAAERLRDELEPDISPQELEAWAVRTVLNRVGDLSAPPRYERPIGPQEAETVLCKYKSYKNGRYKIGEDIESCRKSLGKFLSCKTAQHLLKSGKKSELW